MSFIRPVTMCSWAAGVAPSSWSAGSATSFSTFGREMSVRASMLTCWSMSGWNVRLCIRGLSTVCVST